jgi:transcriptional regulator with XRE-family HTH domain
MAVRKVGEVRVDKEKLKKARLNADKTLKQVAAETGVTHTTIHGYETGRQPTKPNILERIASVLKVTLSDITESFSPSARRAATLENRRLRVLLTTEETEETKDKGAEDAGL